MEGDDEIQRQVSKFQKITCNGSSVISDTSSNPNKIATQKGNHLFPLGDGGGGDGGGGGGIGRLCGWPSSRIVRVSRASGGKDRHSKVLTSKGLRDRRIRLSVSTAIEFYDLQDRLGYDQPSKAVEWLIKAASSSIDELPSLDPAFPGGGCDTGTRTGNHHQEIRQLIADNNNKSVENETDFEDPNHQLHQQNNSNSNSNNNNNACSSTSETSKGSGLSLSRSENRIRARERARDLAAKKEKVSSINSSFTDLLTGGININTSSNNNNNHSNSHNMDYFQMQQFNNIPTGSNQHQQDHQPQSHQFPFFQGNYAPGGLASGLNRGTLQSNLLSHHQHSHQLQRSFQPMVDGSTSANFPFFMAHGPDHFQAGFESQRLQLYGGGRHSDHYKEKSKN